MATYKELFKVGSPFEFDTANGRGIKSVRVFDDAHYFTVWAGSGTDGFAQVIAVNTTTFALSTAAAALEFDTQNFDFGSHIGVVDTNHFLVSWVDTVNTVTAQVLAVNTTTWAVTTAGARLDYETSGAGDGFITIYNVFDAAHYLVVHRGTGGDGFAQVLNVNTTTFAVTTITTPLEFETSNYFNGELAPIDANHFLLINNGTTGDVQLDVLAVNTTTWAVTTAATRLTLESNNPDSYSAIVQIDENHYVALYSGPTSATVANWSMPTAQVIAVNTTTFAISTASDLFRIVTLGSDQLTDIKKLDDNHVAVHWSQVNPGETFEHWGGVLNINTTTWAITTEAAYTRYDAGDGVEAWSVPIPIDSTHWLHFYGGTGADGFVQVVNYQNVTVQEVSGAVQAISIAEDVTQVREVIFLVDTNEAVSVVDSASVALTFDIDPFDLYRIGGKITEG